MPRNFERETSEALSTLRTLLPTDVNAVAGLSSLTLNRSHDSQGGLLDRSLEFQAILVADLVHARKFDDKASWIRCVGVYLAIWTDNETGITFSETVRSHYRMIDQASHKSNVCFKFPSVLIYIIRLSMVLGKMCQKATKYCAIHSFRWRMEPFFFFRIQLFALSVVADMVSSGLTGLGSQHSCANYVMVKWKIFPLQTSSSVSWWNTPSKGRMGRCQYSTSLPRVRKTII